MSTNDIQFGSYNPSAPEDTLSLSIGLFFDGTRNNKDNTDERLANTNIFQQKGKNSDEDTSYYNDWSNVARLWEQYQFTNERIYIEGIGTVTKGEDSTEGAAFGTGYTGIRGKVRQGCKKLAQEIKNKAKKSETNVVAAVYLYVFGFSRGAAAARNFTYEIGKQSYKAKTIDRDGYRAYYDSDLASLELVEIKKDKNKNGVKMLPAMGHLGFELQKLNIKVEYIKVHFLGVFDTVASFGFKHKDDVKELHLNELNKATHVVHFTAENEHRENFGLDTTSTGITKEFPGVHSDIGGGYNTGTETVDEIETDWIVNPLRTTSDSLNTLGQKLISEAWYRQGELTIRKDSGESYFKLTGIRSLDKTYSYIPLHFMADYAVGKNTSINKSELQKKYSITSNPLLVRVKERLNTYINKNGSPYKFNPNGTTFDEQKDLRELRNKYLHWSADRDGIGMDPAKYRKRPIYP